ncbi:hypothetical protein EI42_05047 [Thermosporothrix hazakensis]|jgi:hypothetical protein|uniref:Uncharacterized protein n=2 Tax=Thermosporothrix TaxID=768650 RepID=A0A326U1B8_THEHA|nr:hypothetical protein EI42_05047 [Thermosporothrix hazakensis]BBH89771.1 hypothetical protein KTC_45220 [Thermosporothrix sp. COM3]GCE47960.1 hypothetical protein KTH_28290 [Thermosporothrix hazakensis]
MGRPNVLATPPIYNVRIFAAFGSIITEAKVFFLRKAITHMYAPPGLEKDDIP